MVYNSRVVVYKRILHRWGGADSNIISPRLIISEKQIKYKNAMQCVVCTDLIEMIFD